MSWKARPNAPIAVTGLFPFCFWISTASKKLTTPTATWLAAALCAALRTSCGFIAARLTPPPAMAETNLLLCCRRRKKRKRKAWPAAFATSWKWIRKSRRSPPASESAFIAGTESASRNYCPTRTPISIRKKQNAAAAPLQPHAAVIPALVRCRPSSGAAITLCPAQTAPIAPIFWPCRLPRRWSSDPA